MSYCPNCSAKIAIDSRACPACGADLQSEGGWRPLANPPPVASEPLYLAWFLFAPFATFPVAIAVLGALFGPAGPYLLLPLGLPILFSTWGMVSLVAAAKASDENRRKMLIILVVCVVATVWSLATVSPAL
ncbi:MAG: zinc ribbon domain-containing protein [Rhodoferax sp.]|nr:zinc ribbon domain-containing protein [Rhodoferax sp.]